MDAASDSPGVSQREAQYTVVMWHKAVLKHISSSNMNMYPLFKIWRKQYEEQYKSCSIRNLVPVLERILHSEWAWNG